MEQNGRIQESMYLVVRSLKINNEKIVSNVYQLLREFILTSNAGGGANYDFSVIVRIMKFKSETF